jgi:hypothetical protein
VAEGQAPILLRRLCRFRTNRLGLARTVSLMKAEPKSGDVQVMTAGAGIRHAEYNLADACCGLRAIPPAGPVTRCDGQHSGLVRRWS